MLLVFCLVVLHFLEELFSAFLVRFWCFRCFWFFFSEFRFWLYNLLHKCINPIDYLVLLFIWPGKNWDEVLGMRGFFGVGIRWGYFSLYILLYSLKLSSFNSSFSFIYDLDFLFFNFNWNFLLHWLFLFLFSFCKYWHIVWLLFIIFFPIYLNLLLSSNIYFHSLLAFFLNVN